MTFLLIEPATGSAQGNVAVLECGIVEHLKSLESLLLTEHLELVECGPPVVVVALDDDLLAGDRVHKSEILHCGVQAHCPAEVAQ